MTEHQSSDRAQTASSPLVDVVVLTWNDGALLEAAIASAQKSIGAAVRVIVVDNGSDPPAQPALSDTDILIRSASNRGVAAGRNLGVHAGSAEYVCLLDSDARLHPDTLSVLLLELQVQPEVALAGPIFDGQPPTASGGLAPTLSTKLRRLTGRGSLYEASSETDGVYDVDFVIGACQVFRRSAYEEVRGLNESYFYGPEDADFCMRLRLAGWRVVQVADATCFHPPRRRNRKVVSRSGARHAGAVLRFLWAHRNYRRRLKATG